MSGAQNFTDQMVAAAMATESERCQRREALDAAREHLTTLSTGYSITPGELQRALRCSWNLACSLLEELEREGTLSRAGATVPAVYQAAKPAFAPSCGYALPLSQREHGALLRLLDEHLGDLARPVDNDTATLRAVRSRLKRP